MSALQFKEFYFINQMIKLRKMRSAVPVAHMEEKGNVYGVLVKISEHVLKTEAGKTWTRLLWLRIENMVIHLQFPYNVQNFFTRRGTVSFSRWILPRRVNSGLIPEVLQY